MLQELIAVSRCWSGEVKALSNQGETVSLKKVESLISEGEKLPFDFVEVSYYALFCQCEGS